MKHVHVFSFYFLQQSIESTSRVNIKQELYRTINKQKCKVGKLSVRHIVVSQNVVEVKENLYEKKRKK